MVSYLTYHINKSKNLRLKISKIKKKSTAISIKMCNHVFILKVDS